ncbi:MAG: AAA family ATPase [Bacteroidales bacterium]|nr:AAA family ATPase [Bacteroidales bacterium]
MSESVKISTYGSYKRTISRNAYNGRTIFLVDAADIAELKHQCAFLGKTFLCIGIIPEYKVHTPLHIEGYVKSNEKGYSVECESVVEQTWDLLSASSYIEHICSGITPLLAEKIAKLCKGDIFGYIKCHSPEQLSAEAQLPIEKAAALYDSIRNTGMQREVFALLHPHGATWANATKIVSRYGVGSIDQIKSNPYAVGVECSIDYSICDRFAKENNFSATDERRIKHTLHTALMLSRNSGNTFAYTSDACRLANRVVKKSAYKESIPSTLLINTIQNDQSFVLDYSDEGDEGIYSISMYNAEKDTAYHIARLMANKIKLPYSEEVIDMCEKDFGITYAPEQKKCFSLLKQSGVAIVTGGPGTGKSTVINGLITAYKKLNPEKIIKLCAPTGRAAQRMSECTNVEATTIHRLLEYKPFGNEITHKSASDPIEADLIVVDETSMIDIELSSIFFSAIRSGSLVLFIGDINQLPSVGAGDVLRDMLTSEMIPTVQLRTVYRQGLKSPIVQNAIRIQNGVSVFIENEEYKNICVDDDMIKPCVLTQVMSSYNPLKPFDTQVLCPTHKGDAGVAELNKLMQNILNPPNSQKKEIRYGSRVYRVGDKIVMLSNNYNTGYYNGDIGTVLDIDANNNVIVKISDKAIILTSEDLEDMNLAYAMTIHKSQGSEFANVIVTLPSANSSMLKRNLIYTAITRAKKTVVVIAGKTAISQAVSNTDFGNRNSRLSQRITREMSKVISGTDMETKENNNG